MHVRPKVDWHVKEPPSAARTLVAEARASRYEEGDRTSYTPEEVDGLEKLPNHLTTAVYNRNL